MVTNGKIWRELTHGEKMACLEYAAWLSKKKKKKKTLEG